MFTRQALGVEMSQLRALGLQVSALGCQKVAWKVTGRRGGPLGETCAPGSACLCPSPGTLAVLQALGAPWGTSAMFPSPPIVGESPSRIGDAGVKGRLSVLE